ncbi:MAG: UDP-N-acetylglucosamine--N-acetylmuramyl-(pentapeptide) pyrophosphoryl-undecaprenol N-acetylglucosamine transferase, partial [Francisellaceae bacterium]
SFDRNRNKVRIIGNPVRPEIIALNSLKRDFYQHELNVLILGGSQGAQILNRSMPEVIKDLIVGTRPNVWHQSGEKDFELTQKSYEGIEGIDIRVSAFIDDMACAYAWAHVVVCRSGALTVSEVAACGLPAFFIPFPHAVDDHQYHNAQFLAQAGAAVCMRQSHFTHQKLAAFLRAMDLNRQSLVDMAAHAKGVAKLDATEKLLDSVKRWII